MTEWQLGVRAFQEGRLREATDRLRSSIADHDRTVSQVTGVQIYAYLGAALYALGDATGAAEAFAKAVELRVENTVPLDLTINLANAYIASGKRKQAEQVLATALHDSPGAMEVRTLLERLQSRDPNLPLTGTILGETPQSVKHYMETLSFSTATQGYSPEQVKAALAQIGHYVDVLSARLASHNHTISQYEAEIERLRQSEETLVGNLVELRQNLDRAHRDDSRRGGETQADEERADLDEGPTSLTPLEKLFQKKS